MSKRTGLKVIQASATSDSIIVGNDRLSLEADLKKRNSSSHKKKKSSLPFSVYEDSVANVTATFQDKSTNTGETTVNESIDLSSADLTQETPSEGYWKELAETRRQALAEALEENETLHNRVKSLSGRVKELENWASKYEELVDHSEQLANTVQMLLGSSEGSDPISAGDVGSDSEELCTQPV